MQSFPAIMNYLGTAAASTVEVCKILRKQIYQDVNNMEQYIPNPILYKKYNKEECNHRNV